MPGFIDNRYTPLEVIDRLFPKQPVVIIEQTSHSMWVNSAALKLAGINQNSPELQGGKILKEAVTAMVDYIGNMVGITFGCTIAVLEENSIQ